MNVVKETEQFRMWRMSLPPGLAASKVRARLERLKFGNPGNAKSVGHGVFELKIDFGPGIRMYYTQIEKVTYLMLCGGDKDSQQRDIQQAHAIAAKLKG